MIVLLDAENRTIVSSFLWTKHRNATDGQTDRISLAITAMQTRCKIYRNDNIGTITIATVSVISSSCVYTSSNTQVPCI